MKAITQFIFIPVILGLAISPALTAQTFTNLYDFTASLSNNNESYPINSDGAQPFSSLVLSGTTLYGTASAGGSSGNGTVFAINTDGTGFTNLYTFSAFKNTNTNSDGARPSFSLVLSGNTLYGTAQWGGSAGNGTIFSISTNGTGFTNLYSFSAGSGFFYPYDSFPWITNSDGAIPIAGLILSGTTLYGTTSGGGTGGVGTVFAINTDGTSFTNLYSFTTPDPNTDTNGDGTKPVGGLILSGNILYGTATRGGSSSFGTVFAINTNGTGFTNLYNFTTLTSNTNSDGCVPEGGLLLLGNTLYGTASHGGSGGVGTVFAISTNGSGFTNLHNFTATEFNTNSDEPYPNTNSDGAYPICVLISSGDTLYGTAQLGGTSGNGTVFEVNTDGSNFMTLHNFVGNEGNFLEFGLILSGNAMYGTALGGSNGTGTIFKLLLPPPHLTITLSGNNVILAWPTNMTGFNLEFATNLVSPVIWNSVPVVNGQNTVTNPISGTQGYYRLNSSSSL